MRVSFTVKIQETLPKGELLNSGVVEWYNATLLTWISLVRIQAPEQKNIL